MVEAEEKIAGLLQVKEKLFNVQVMRGGAFLAILQTKYLSNTNISLRRRRRGWRET